MPKPFEAEQKSLEELMGGKNAYAIPLYQRRYVWRNEQNDKLWEDVKECYENKTNHFLGSLVLMDYEKDEYDSKYQADELIDHAFEVRHIVDGQQRLTSLTLLLVALFQDMRNTEQAFWKAPDLDEQLEEDWNDLKSKMRRCFLTDVRDKHSKSGKGYIPRIVPVRSIYEAYKTLLNREGAGKQLLVEKAFHFHFGNVKKYREECLPSTVEGFCGDAVSPADEIYAFYDQMYISIASRMKIIRIDCAANEDAFQVFESLNGTGLSLTASDRIKNILMGLAAKEGQSLSTSRVESEWQQIDEIVGKGANLEAFLGSYMFTVAGKRVSKKDLTKVFQKQYLSQFESVSKALQDLRFSAKCYATLTRLVPYETKEGCVKQLPADLKSYLEGMRRNNPSQSVVPMLAASRAYGIDSSEFKSISRSILVLLVRHKVCQKSANLLDRYFEKLLDDMRNKTVQEVLDGIRANTQRDQSFRSAFEELSFEKGSSFEMSRARYYLVAIENYLRNKTGDCSLASEEDLTLEHIIPQAVNPETWFDGDDEIISRFNNDGSFRDHFNDDVINSIGNMCLLRRPENSSASNKSFASKKKAYESPDESGKTAVSTFQLVSQLVENDMRLDDGDIVLVSEGSTFNEESVQKRARALADYAVAIWNLE